MSREELTSTYFEWIYRFVNCEKYFRHLSYRRLFKKLFETEFIYIIDMDGNRADDGIELRYRFGYEYGIDDCVIAEGLDDKPCSILEMMVALSIRCEESIMLDDTVGNRIGQWFWSMVVSLGLGKMSDNKFDGVEVSYILDSFLMRRYHPNGSGGLFTLDHPPRDMRNAEIWYQAMWYLNEVS